MMFIKKKSGIKGDRGKVQGDSRNFLTWKRSYEQEIDITVIISLPGGVGTETNNLPGTIFPYLSLFFPFFLIIAHVL